MKKQRGKHDLNINISMFHHIRYLYYTSLSACLSASAKYMYSSRVLEPCKITDISVLQKSSITLHLNDDTHGRLVYCWFNHKVALATLRELTQFQDSSLQWTQLHQDYLYCIQFCSVMRTWICVQEVCTCREAFRFTRISCHIGEAQNGVYKAVLGVSPGSFVVSKNYTI